MTPKFLKLKPKIKKLWIEALRSGKYKQGTTQLKTNNNEFCCLGVLCDIHRKVTKKIGWKYKDIHDDGDLTQTYDNENLMLPKKVAKWAFAKWVFENKEVPEYIDPLIGKNLNASVANDQKGMSFKKIANFIERNL